MGGDPACWVHLVGDLDEGSGPERPMRVDLSRLASQGSGAVWSLPHGGDLDANLVRLGPAEAIGEHVNGEVDVFVVVWDGSGELVSEEWSAALHAGVVVLVPRGVGRSIRAGESGLRYLSIHRRRGPLTIGRRA
jgi:quercetin dioxygenase-like cupin family protein